MDGDKDFLTYKEQMQHLRRDKAYLVAEKTINLSYAVMDILI